MRTALQARLEKLEAEVERATTPGIGAQIAAILSGQEPRPRRSDEELARTKVGRLLLERRRRAELNYQD
jgi:hypothetical protein